MNPLVAGSSPAGPTNSLVRLASDVTKNHSNLVAVSTRANSWRRVYVHWSVLVVVALLALVSIRSPIHAAVAIASYLGIIVIHEAGHAWVAHRLGYGVDAIHVSFLHGYCTHDMPYNETDHVLMRGAESRRNSWSRFRS